MQSPCINTELVENPLELTKEFLVFDVQNLNVLPLAAISKNLCGITCDTIDK